MRIESEIVQLNKQRAWYSSSSEGIEDGCLQKDKFFQRVERYIDLRGQDITREKNRKFGELISLIANASKVM